MSLRIVIAGGHGQIAQHLGRRLADAGHTPVGLIRNTDHESDLRDAGAEPLLLDLESADVDQVASALEGADAVVFAAGAGPDSGPERKQTVDRDGAILLADAAQKAAVTRYVIVSSMGTEGADPSSDDGFQVYLTAKKAADDDLRARDLDWTVLRPGRLTDHEPTGRVNAGSLEYGEIPRADVAAAIAACLTEGLGIRRSFDLVGGQRSISEAIGSLDA